MLDVRPVTAEMVADLGRLLNADRNANGCWCMWFLTPVKQYHAESGEGNRARFEELVDTSAEPVGLMAYRDAVPVGWCAAGPRARYARAIRTPTFKGRDPAEDDVVWLVPCLLISHGARRQGVARRLLAAAVDLARQHGAAAVEGFPFAGDRARYGGDLQVGVEPLFASCGFGVIRRSAGSRVVMRRDLSGEAGHTVP